MCALREPQEVRIRVSSPCPKFTPSAPAFKGGESHTTTKPFKGFSRMLILVHDVTTGYENSRDWSVGKVIAQDGLDGLEMRPCCQQIVEDCDLNRLAFVTQTFIKFIMLSQLSWRKSASGMKTLKVYVLGYQLPNVSSQALAFALTLASASASQRRHRPKTPWG